MSKAKSAPKKKAKEVEVEVEAEINPLDESRELEVAQSEAGVLGGDEIEVDEEAQHLILTRTNLTFIVSGLWLYRHDGSLGDCKGAYAFKGQMAKEFNMRVGDVVICTALGQSPILVEIPE